MAKRKARHQSERKIEKSQKRYPQKYDVKGKSLRQPRQQGRTRS